MRSNGVMTPRKLRAVTCLLECPTVEEASNKVGVSRSTLYEWMKIPEFQEELERAKRKQFQASLQQLRSLVPEAIQGLKELAQSNNEQVRLRACLEILKATRAYGANVSPAPFSPDDSPLKVSIEHTGKLTLQIFEKVMSGEISASEANSLLMVLNKLEQLGNDSLLDRHKYCVQKLKEDLQHLLDKEVKNEEDFRKLSEELHKVWNY